MVKSLPPLALIAGPTASGKSALALALAEATGGVIVNADSAQLYRDLDIVSARPSPADLARADHRLYGVLDGADPCSAARWAGLAKFEIAAIHATNRMPILVGGTGLYLRTLLDGIAPIPSIDPAIRAEVRAASVADNRAALEVLDPVAAARIGPADTTRIARALEVIRSTGRPIGAWHADASGGIACELYLKPLILLPPREWLYARCDARFGAMLAAGAVPEVEALLARRLDPDLPVVRAIGVREIAAHLESRANLGVTLAAGAQATRRYAKRQYTWFANQQPPEWPRFTDPLDEAAIPAALAMLGRNA
ncbi:MAG: tRNA (adenosine(37)-N6)-dimethylallyltransferase MiaA [Sphingomicrobium sp.]